MDPDRISVITVRLPHFEHRGLAKLAAVRSARGRRMSMNRVAIDALEAELERAVVFGELLVDSEGNYHGRYGGGDENHGNQTQDQAARDETAAARDANPPGAGAGGVSRNERPRT